jgi:hypothetical protein
MLAELDAEDVPIAEGRYFEMVPRHVLGDIDTSYRLAVIGPPVRLPELIERPICQDCRIRVAAPRVVASAAEAEAVADLRVLSAQALVGRVDAYLAALSGARAEDPSLLWPELVDALRGWTVRHGNPYEAKNLRALAKDKDLARTFLRAFENDGNLIAGLRERPPAATRQVASGDLLALAEHLYRQERGLSLPRLMQENATTAAPSRARRPWPCSCAPAGASTAPASRCYCPARTTTAAICGRATTGPSRTRTIRRRRSRCGACWRRSARRSSMTSASTRCARAGCRCR